MAFHDVLIKEMRRAGFSKAGLAAAVDVDKAAITRWTAGTTKPSRDSYVRLVKIMPRLRKAFDD